MIVVHGLWRDGRLALWAEDSAIPVQPARPGRAATPHPSAAASDILAEIVADSAIKAPHGTASLSLPTRSGVPVDSPELLRDSLPVRGAISMRTWLVPTLEFEPDEALAVLCEIEPDKVTIGGTVRHLGEMAGFAHDLVVRGRILPSLVRHPGGPQAVWRPVLTGADALWAQSLTLALPPAGRASSPSGRSTATSPQAN
ncbi:MAG: hypothetical protein QOE61_2135, partial [Micromonosporaceae bacterium]|nr:hypothetical protein [Micromonosporaceae bacterium]